MSGDTRPSIDEVLRQDLTDEQRNAATDRNAEVLAIACAGSGKSRTLAYRIAWLVANGAEPSSIVAFTFTEKAADTIKRRVSQALLRVGIAPTVVGAMYIGTIHSYCQHLLGQIDARYRQYEVLDDNRLILFLMSRYPSLGLQTFAPEKKYFQKLKDVCNAWKTMNDEQLNIEDIQAEDVTLGIVLENVAAALERDQFIDFSTMIRSAVEHLQNATPGAIEATANLRHLLVDEYQDVNPCQEALIQLLKREIETLFVVGDDDQSIYAWRGADVSNILSFGRRYPDSSNHNLNVNFRSTSAIVSVADAFVAAELGPSRIQKNPFAFRNTSPRDFRVLWFESRDHEANWIGDRIYDLLRTEYVEPDGKVRGLTPADIAILMRSTRQPDFYGGPPRHVAFTQVLSDRRIPFSLASGGGPFDRPQVATIRDTFELLRAIPTRETVGRFHNEVVLPHYPAASFERLAACLTEWSRLIHTPQGGARRRVYPQQLVHDILHAFGVPETDIADEVMRDIGLFSKMILDVEAVYMSVDSTRRFQDILNFLGNIADSGYDVSTDDVMARPDTITVSTVHGVKGLEFPVVFIVDVESQRFPKKRGAYDGVLPLALLRNALERGAYQSTSDEEARLFFTALTRSERYLYITGAERLPGGKSTRKQSTFANRISEVNEPEVFHNADELPEGLRPHHPVRRIDETVLPTSFSQVRYYLRCPKDYQYRERFGFSPPVPPLFGYGKTVHTIIEKLHERFPNSSPTIDDTIAVANDIFHLKHVPESQKEGAVGPYERAKGSAIEIAATYVGEYQEDFSRRRQVEARFEIPVQNAVIAGSIDLLLKEDQAGHILEAEVIDFKTIEGGEDPTENVEIPWTELSLQVQLYAKAAKDVLSEEARTGHVHLLRDNTRIEIPVTDEAVSSAIENIEWAVKGILSGDFPMRPHPSKCDSCDFTALCRKEPQEFMEGRRIPPEIHTPVGNGRQAVPSFSEFQQ